MTFVSRRNEWPGGLNSSLFIRLRVTYEDHKILLGFIEGPKSRARRYFLSNQIRIFTYLFWSLKIFCELLSDLDFLECSYFVFSWLIEKYYNVTSMLMWFWSEISRMFLFCVLGVDYFKAKNILRNNWYRCQIWVRETLFKSWTVMFT